MANKSSDEQYSDEEAARRRDDAIKRMIATPPTPHKPKQVQSVGPKKRWRQPKKDKSA